jgi:hypothetical protein
MIPPLNLSYVLVGSIATLCVNNALWYFDSWDLAAYMAGIGGGLTVFALMIFDEGMK